MQSQANFSLTSETGTLYGCLFVLLAVEDVAVNLL